MEKIRIILQSAKKEQEREGDGDCGAFDEAGLTHRQRAPSAPPLLDPPLSAQLILPAVADVAAASTGNTVETSLKGKKRDPLHTLGRAPKKIVFCLLNC